MRTLLVAADTLLACHTNKLALTLDSLGLVLGVGHIRIEPQVSAPRWGPPLFTASCFYTHWKRYLPKGIDVMRSVQHART